MARTSTKSSRDPVEQLAEEYMERLRNGERPAIAEFVAQCPEREQEIRELFPALIMMERVGVHDQSSAPKAGAVTRDGSAPQQIGEYVILREVGRGGMGVVYEAEQESLGRRVALKVLPFGALMDPNHLKRFRREARAAARLHHTNIVPVYEVGEHEGIYYYAMQFIRGLGLDEVMTELTVMRARRGVDENSDRDSQRPELCVTSRPADDAALGTDSESRSDSPSSNGGSGVPSLTASSTSDHHYFRSVARVGTQVADALSYAHGQGIMHRDVKPSNLMVDSEGKVWITDFGLAKSDGNDELTHTGDLVGTLRYMAPERFGGWSDPRSDVYSLGLTLYELLTLRPAYDERNRARLIKRISQEQLTPPHRADRAIPVDLETIILKSTAKEPRERYQSAGELAEDLHRFLASKPIEARRTSVAERTCMWCRRNPLVASLAAALVLLLVVGTGAASWAAWHFERIAHQRQQDVVAKNELVEQLTTAKRVATERLHNSGRFHYDQQEYDQAVKDFSAVLQADPDHADSLWWRGHANGNLGHIDEAVEDLSRYIEFHPDASSAYHARASWQWRSPSGSHRRSAEDYRKALEIVPDDVNYMNNLAWHEAMCPPEDRNLDRALQYSLQAIAARPKTWSYNITLGIVHYRRQEYDKAIEVLEKIRRPSDSYACCLLGMSHQQQGDLDQAARYYWMAAGQWTNEKSAPRLRERVMYATEAEALIGTGLQEHPDHFDLLFRRAALRQCLRKPDKVVQDATRMIELRPELNHGYFWRGRARMSLHQNEQAIRDFEKSLAIRPSDYWAFRNLAWLYVIGSDNLHGLEKAEEMTTKAGTLKPHNNLWKEVLGLIHYRRGEFDQAVQTLKGVSNPRDYGVVQSVLAMSYHQLGRAEKAQKHFEQIDEAWGVHANLDPFWNRLRCTLLEEAEELMKQSNEG